MNAKSNVSPVPVLKNDAESIRELITTANYILLAIMTRQGPLTMPWHESQPGTLAMPLPPETPPCPFPFPSANTE